MHLTGLALNNFKRFEYQEVDLRSSITLLLGPNSSGKSSIIKALLGLKQTVSPSNEHEVFATQGDYVDLGTYNDYVYNHNAKLPVSIETEFENIKSTTFLYSSLSDIKVKFKITYQLDYATEQSRIEEIIITITSASNNKSFAILRLQKKKTVASGYWLHFDEDIYSILNVRMFFSPDKIENPISVKHLERLRFIASSKKVRTAYTAFDIFHDLISAYTQALERDLFYLGPLRTSPARSYTRTSHSLAVGPTGDHTPSVLANLEKKHQMARSGKNEAKSNYEALQNWVNIMFPNKRVFTRKYEELVKLKVMSNSDYENSIEDTITDVGFGFSQIIPILVQAAVMPIGSTLIIEQPELHLHPMAQANLSRVIVSAANMGKRFVIETHSEHFLRGLQLEISRYKLGDHTGLSKDRLKILYVPEPPNPVINLKTNEWGELTSKMPTGFFDEAYKLAFELMQNKSKSINSEKG